MKYIDNTGGCAESEFECAAGYCIEDYKRCNQIKDCPSGNDELDCTYEPGNNFFQFFKFSVFDVYFEYLSVFERSHQLLVETLQLFMTNVLLSFVFTSPYRHFRIRA